MMRLLRIITGVLLLGLLMTACSSIFGSDDDTIRLRLENQTGFDFDEVKLWFSSEQIGTAEEIGTLEHNFKEMSDGETTEYLEISDSDLIDTYNAMLQVRYQNLPLILSLSSARHSNRTVEMSPGNYTYQLRFTEQVYLTYHVLGDEDSETGETEVRIYNASDKNYASVLVKRYKTDETSSEYIDFGPVMSGEFTAYKAVENAIQHTIIEITTEDGEQVDNDPPDHFGNELAPGKYTYEVEVRTNDKHDISRIVRD